MLVVELTKNGRRRRKQAPLATASLNFASQIESVISFAVGCEERKKHIVT